MLLCYCYSCCSTPMTQGPVTIIGEDEMAATCCTTRSSGMNVAFMLWCLMWGGPGLKYLCSGLAANFGPLEAEGGPRGAMSVGEERKKAWCQEGQHYDQSSLAGVYFCYHFFSMFYPFTFPFLPFFPIYRPFFSSPFHLSINIKLPHYCPLPRRGDIYTTPASNPSNI